MGQYHITANLDKREYIHPHEIGLGLKQLEQIGAFDASMGDVLFLLLSCSPNRGGGDSTYPDRETDDKVIGRWAGDRVAVVGDYADAGDLPAEWGDAESLYINIRNNDGWRDISPLILPMIEYVFGVRVTGDGWRKREIAGGGE